MEFVTVLQLRAKDASVDLTGPLRLHFWCTRKKTAVIATVPDAVCRLVGIEASRALSAYPVSAAAFAAALDFAAGTTGQGPVLLKAGVMGGLYLSSRTAYSAFLRKSGTAPVWGEQVSGEQHNLTTLTASDAQRVMRVAEGMHGPVLAAQLFMRTVEGKPIGGVKLCSADQVVSVATESYDSGEAGLLSLGYVAFHALRDVALKQHSLVAMYQGKLGLDGGRNSAYVSATLSCGVQVVCGELALLA
jgi:hypothetical protein